MALLDRAWALLTSVWAKTGCNIDPNGRCTKEGCNIDPNGRCAPAPVPVNRMDTGCNIDPDSRCGV
jgi:hypothetical protein